MATAKNYQPSDLNLQITTGAWTWATTSNIQTFKHTAAAESSIVSVPVPDPKLSGKTQNAPSIITAAYTVVTADLSAAPTAVLNKYSYAASTGVTTRSAVTQATITFGGVDTTGVAAGAAAAGTHTVIIRPATVAALADNEKYLVEITFPCALTSAVALTNFEFTYA